VCLPPIQPPSGQFFQNPTKEGNELRGRVRDKETGKKKEARSESKVRERE
jgi:hypothetical protein